MSAWLDADAIRQACAARGGRRAGRPPSQARFDCHHVVALWCAELRQAWYVLPPAKRTASALAVFALFFFDCCLG